jgi:carboxylesterase
MSTSGAPAGWIEPYFAQGTTHSDIGIILVHGFTGSPASMRPWAHYLNDRGYTVAVPLLPGHVTHWSDLNKVKWQAWPKAVQAEIDSLRPKVKKLFVFGLSMGGGTTLNIAEKNALDGICLVNPMIHIPGVQIKFAPIISRFVSHLSSVGDDTKKPGVTEWGYDDLPTRGVLQLHKMLKETRANLEKVKAPLLLFHSVDDHVLPVSNSNIIMSESGSMEKSRIELTNSYHVATLDFDASLIFANSLAFIESHS